METKTEKLRRVVGECRQQLNPLIFVGPPIFTLIIAIFLLSSSMEDTRQIKTSIEYAGYYLLLPAGLIAFIRFCIERNYFFLMLTGVIATVIMREIHWEWTSEGVYVLFILFMWAAYAFYDRLKPFVSSASFINLAITVLSFYFISEMLLDHNWLRIPEDFGQEVNLRSSLEECIEMAGHTVLSVSVLLIRTEPPA